MLFLMPCFTGTVHLNFVLEFVVWLTVLHVHATCVCKNSLHTIFTYHMNTSKE